MNHDVIGVDTHEREFRGGLVLTSAKHNSNDETGKTQQMCVGDTGIKCISLCMPASAKDSFLLEQAETL